MATIVLAAAGGAIGSAIGGSVLGISSAIIGQAVGATIGRAIDQRVMGAGSQTVETGQIDRFRLSGAGEGLAIPQVYGQTRVSGQVIWASQFLETVTTTTQGGGGGGKGGQPSSPEITTTEYSYSVSLALALCEGEIRRIGRIWADGVEVAPDSLNWRAYSGSADQLPDPKIEAVEGADNTPAYRGTAYIVIEDLPLGQFGNRVPQFSFEVYRNAAPEGGRLHLSNMLPGVALIPGTGEYALATTPVHVSNGPGQNSYRNVNTPGNTSDFVRSEAMLRAEVPACRSVSLVVSWFGNDLRCEHCIIRPQIEFSEADGVELPYSVGSMTRAGAGTVPRLEGRPIYGGTPSDASVIEAIRQMHAFGQHVTFYPFILMDQLAGNGLPDPWGEAAEQAQMPWRGRITLSAAPGQPGSPDRTAAAQAEVDAFFGTATAADYSQVGDSVLWSGTPDFRYRHFILHQAMLCKAAGGVESFCIGSEMRALTQIRSGPGLYPAVAALKALAAEVRAILGPGVKIGYAADWSEYFGHQPQDGTGDVVFHLDPLWADANIDFIGIDNYMPLSDWRAGVEHSDAPAGSIYDLSYLGGNVAGGEGFDWYYRDDQERATQLRTPIEDGAHGEDWVFRYKDLVGWWSNRHHDRVGGVRAATPTAWEPESKPIWFTEIGCPAVEKGTNQPNKFIDLLSSESSIPYFSNGRRDDLIQHQYLQATLTHWRDPAKNPVSSVYGGFMVDPSKIYAWAWDLRPWPQFPNQQELWADGPAYLRGHWLNGRLTAQPLSEVVAEICQRSGVWDYDVSELYGLVRGYTVAEISTARQALQPLMLVHGFDAIERDGVLVFRSRREEAPRVLDPETLAEAEGLDGRLERTRAAEAEMAERVQLAHIEHGGSYAIKQAEAVMPGEPALTVSRTDVPMVLAGSEARSVTERWLSEARVARETLRFAVPPSQADVAAGELVELPDAQAGATLMRIDRIEEGGARLIEATRVSSAVYEASDAADDLPPAQPFRAPTPVFPAFLDLPLLTGAEDPLAPWIAVAGAPWPGPVSVYASPEDFNYALERQLGASAHLGQTLTALPAARPGLPDRGAALEVRMSSGTLASVGAQSLLLGANLAAIGDGSPGGWELFQFRDAVAVDQGVFALTHRLRGQLGTEAEMAADRPAGSLFVLLTPAMQQLSVVASTLGLPRHYRVGPSSAAIDSPAFVHRVETFEGRGLRPYAPSHLKAEGIAAGIRLRWIRRTRIDGDRWDLAEVPLGEDREAYRIEVRNDLGTVLRAEEATAPEWIYTAAMQAADGVSAPYTLAVAQLSDRYGPGPFGRILIND